MNMAEGGKQCTNIDVFNDSEPCAQIDLPTTQTERAQQQHSFFIKDHAGGCFTNIHSAANVMINGRMTVYMNTESYKKKRIKPKKSLTKSTAAITSEQKLNIQDRLGNDWKDLGRRLDFDDAELDQMRLEYKDDPRELNYQILNRWQQRKPQSALQANLAKIFTAMSRGDLADLLAENN